MRGVGLYFVDDSVLQQVAGKALEIGHHLENLPGQ
jgi:hypothetical protein